MDAKTLFLATRPWSFTMTFSSVTLGALLAALRGYFDVIFYVITLGGMIAFHAATNVLNDFYDVRHGVDRLGAPTTKYRPHPSALGQASLGTILELALSLYALTLMAGVYLAYARSPLVLVLVAAGVLGSVLYTADPVVLKAKGLGEVTVFLMWGPLIPLGSYLVQTGEVSLTPVVAAIPIGLLVALVLLANNIRDIEYDGSVDMKTVAVMMGRKSAITLYGAMLVATYLFVPLLILVGTLPIWSLISFLTLKDAWGLWRMFQGRIPDDADPRTAGVALHFALLYMAALLLQILLPMRLL